MKKWSNRLNEPPSLLEQLPRQIDQSSRVRLKVWMGLLQRQNAWFEINGIYAIGKSLVDSINHYGRWIQVASITQIT